MDRKSDLFSSAKIVAEAAQCAYNKETDKIDKSNVAGAAEDLLGAASEYGKLKEKGYGEYVEKAENYLHEYKTSSSTSPEKTTEVDPKKEEGEKSGTTDGGGFGLGDAFKKAEGLFKF